MKARWLLIILVLALMLAGCNSTNENTPGSTTPDPGFNEMDPAGQAAGEETSAPAAPGEGEPVTINAPVLASTVLVYDVGSLDGQLGDTTGLVLDGVTGQLNYLVVETVGPDPSRTLLLPWGSFQLVAQPGEGELEGAEPTPQVWLTVERQEALESPEFDASVLEDSQDLAAGWDQQHLEYWSGVLPDLPVTGAPAEADAEAEPAKLIYVRDGTLKDINFGVRTPGNDQLGEIRDFIIDLDGRAAFAVLRPSQGEAEGLVPVPWTALVWSPSAQVFTINVAPETLDQAPRLDPNNLPDMTLPGWEEDWREFWEGQGSVLVDPTPTGEGTASVLQLGQLVDQPVITAEGQVLGRLIDWVLDMTGQSEFAVMARGEDTVLLPWNALSWQEDSGLVYLLDQQAMEQAPSYNSMADLEGDPDWYEGAVGYWSSFTEIDQPQATLDPEAGLEQLRAVPLIGAKVVDVEDIGLGTVDEILLNLQGVVDYMVVQAGGLFRPVPWVNFEYDTDEKYLVYLDDVSRLADAPGFTTLEEMAAGQPQWDVEIRKYWGME